MEDGNEESAAAQGSIAEASMASMASSLRGKNSAKTADELKKARESRAAEAIRMKDEQLRILSDQNANLLSNLDKVYLSLTLLNFVGSNTVTTCFCFFFVG